MSKDHDNHDYQKMDPDSTTPSDVEKGEMTIQSSSNPLSAIRQHFNDEVGTSCTVIILCLCWFTTGFLDSTMFTAYRTFVSMQTGNTIFIGLGASPNALATRPYSWAKSLVSLIAFLLGSLFFSRLSLFLASPERPLRRLTFTLSFALQASLVLVAACLLQASVVESRIEFIVEEIDWLHVVPIVLLSLQAPGQVSTSRQLGMPESPTVVVSTMIYDFAADGKLWERSNPPRARRFVGFVTMLLGAIAGGWTVHRLRHVTLTVWIVLGIKVVTMLAWVAWPKKKTDEG